MNAFEFSVLAALRVGQLVHGCTPRVNGSSKKTVVAQQEIAEGKIVAAPRSDLESGNTPLKSGAHTLRGNRLAAVPPDKTDP